MNKAENLEKMFLGLGAQQAVSYSSLPDFYTYTVTNGPNILAIGKAGSKPRIRSFFRGAKGSALHNKTFVVCAAHTLYGPNTILIRSARDAKEAKEFEKKLDIAGFPKIYIDGQPLKSIFEVSQYFWTLLKNKHGKEVSSSLNTAMKLVCDNGDVLSSLLKRLGNESAEFNEIVGNFFDLGNHR